MLVNKYKPDNLENIIGNSTSIKSIQKWFENLYTGNPTKEETKTTNAKAKTTTKPKTTAKSDSKHICALLSGPNGIGKTLTVELLIHAYNLNPISLNPDEKVDKEYITNVIIPSIQRKKSFTNKQNIFVVHDIDCYDDYGFISSMVTCLKETKIPVIATCNNRYDQSLKPIIPYCLDVKFQKLSANDILKFIKPIIKKESISISDVVLNQLVEDSNCDMRSIFNNLQLLHTSKSRPNNNSSNINSKDKTISNIFEVTKLFMSQNIELNDKQTLFWMNNDILPLMIHENYPLNNIKMKNEALHLNNISQSISSLSDIDLLEKAIHTNNTWELLPYVSMNSIKAVTNCHTKTQINFTSFFQKNASKKQTMNTRDIIDIRETKNNNIPKAETKKKSSPKTKVKITKTKATKTKANKVDATDTKPTVEISEVQEKPKIARRKKVKLIIEE